MHTYAIFQAVLDGVVALTPLVLIFIYGKWKEQHQYSLNTLVEALKLGNATDYGELSQVLVDMNRNHETLKTSVESLELQMTDVKDIMNRRFNRLSTRMTRDTQEGEEGEAPADVEATQLLLDQVEPDLDNGYAESLARPGRRRLVRRSSRRYGR